MTDKIIEKNTEEIPTNPTVRRQSNWKNVFSMKEMGVYYALIVLVVILAITTSYLGRPNYLSMQNISNVLYQASLTAIIAVSMTVILVSGNFDLSVASVAALSAAVLLGTADSIGFIPAAVVAMGIALLLGLINGAIVQFIGINAFIVTLGTLTAVRGLVLVYSDGKTMFVTSDDVISAMKAFENGTFSVGYLIFALGLILAIAGGIKALRGNRTNLAKPLGILAGGLFLISISWFNGFQIHLAKPVIYMFVFASIVWSVMIFSNVGRNLYAVGGNPEAARLSGINVTRYKMLSFAMCSATAGFAGILFASRLRSMNPNAMQGTELTVIAAAILGGTSLFGGKGSVAKSVAGALLLFTLNNGFNIANLGANYQGLVEGVVIIVAAGVYTIGGSQRS